MVIVSFDEINTALVNLKKYTKSSITTIFTTLRRLLTTIGTPRSPVPPGSREFLDTDVVLDFDKVHDSLEKSDISINIKRMIMTNLIGVLTAISNEFQNITISPELAQKYVAYARELSQKHADDYLYSEPTEKEKKNQIEWSDVLDMQKQLYTKIYPHDTDEHHESEEHHDVPIPKMTIGVRRDFIRLIILSLYTFIPPLRQSEYLETIIVPHFTDVDQSVVVPTNNYYALDTSQFIMLKSKTVRSHGIRIINAPPPLAKIISDFHTKYGTKYLIPADDEDRQVTEESFTMKLNRIFKKNVSSSMLRKLYISTFARGMCKIDRKKLAYIMNHTIGTQELVYNKFEKK